MKLFYNINKFTRNYSNYYALFYKYIPDIIGKRAKLRSEHFEHIKTFEEEGKLLLAGKF